MADMREALRRALLTFTDEKKVGATRRKPGRTVAWLHRASGIKCSRVSLHRKLFGTPVAGGKRSYQPLSIEEAQLLAHTLRLRLDVTAK